MATRKPPAPRRLTEGQKRARQLARERMRALNKARRTEATEIARSAKLGAERKARQINNANRRTLQKDQAKRHDRALDNSFF